MFLLVDSSVMRHPVAPHLNMKEMVHKDHDAQLSLFSLLEMNLLKKGGRERRQESVTFVYKYWG